jgi:MSHA pilin protein MshD
MRTGYRGAQSGLRAGGMTPQRGMTLIELVIAIVIIGIASAALYTAMASITGRSADPMLRQQSLAIAEAYLEEIALQAFPVITACAASNNGAGRASFDDVCDYNGLFYSTQTYAPRNALSSTPLSGLEAYQVNVAVASASPQPPSSLTWNGLPLNDVLYIQVTVTDPAGQDLVLGGYRARY